MCGIIGYVGDREAKPLLLQGLKRLEYRGYDSAGIALNEDGSLEYVRAVGNLQNLVDAAGPNGSSSHHGLGHTRWATHGGVTELNAHPLTGCDAAKIAIVLNGIVENYRELKGQLIEEGHTFTSETDAEVVAHLLERDYDGDLAQALVRVYPQLEGHFSIVAIHHDHPDLLVGVRHQTPLVVGVGEGEMFIASSVAAFLSETRAFTSPTTARSSRSRPPARASSPTASRSRSTPSSRSTGTRRSPRRAATRRSCSRRSTSSRRRCARRSAIACAVTISCSTRSG